MRAASFKVNSGGPIRPTVGPPTSVSIALASLLLLGVGAGHATGGRSGAGGTCREAAPWGTVAACPVISKDDPAFPILDYGRPLSSVADPGLLESNEILWKAIAAGDSRLLSTLVEGADVRTRKDIMSFFADFGGAHHVVKYLPCEWSHIVDEKDLRATCTRVLIKADGECRDTIETILWAKGNGIWRPFFPRPDVAQKKWVPVDLDPDTRKAIERVTDEFTGKKRGHRDSSGDHE